MNQQQRASLELRSQILRRLREFFWQREFLEVETPLLAAEVIPEQHIEPRVVAGTTVNEFLQASPELHMKRLVCEGTTCEELERIFQVTRSFRGHEHGPLHRSEFTLVEWYRTGDDMAAGMALLDELLQHTVNTPVAKRTSYRAAFEKELQVDPHVASASELSDIAVHRRIDVPESLRDATHETDRDEWLNLLLSYCIEPTLGLGGPELLFDYPVGQSALARVEQAGSGAVVAKRFELYWQGVELANGYDELTDAAALRQRLEQVNKRRTSEGRTTLPLPESLLAAMQNPGLPACSGCALGLDRLVMVASGATTFAQIATLT